jgi:hypothetical protein
MLLFVLQKKWGFGHGDGWGMEMVPSSSGGRKEMRLNCTQFDLIL